MSTFTRHLLLMIKAHNLNFHKIKNESRINKQITEKILSTKLNFYLMFFMIRVQFTVEGNLLKILNSTGNIKFEFHFSHTSNTNK